MIRSPSSLKHLYRDLLMRSICRELVCLNLMTAKPLSLYSPTSAKYTNRNTVKHCTPNVSSIIQGNNKQVLQQQQSDTNSNRSAKTCNCKVLIAGHKHWPANIGEHGWRKRRYTVYPLVTVLWSRLANSTWKASHKISRVLTSTNLHRYQPDCNFKFNPFWITKPIPILSNCNCPGILTSSALSHVIYV